MTGASHDAIAEVDGLPVYMAPVEFSQLWAVVEAIGARQCLEWGAGGSTGALLARCPFIERYVSIEHDRAWYTEVHDRLVDPRLELHHVAANRPLANEDSTPEARMAWDDRAEVEIELMRDYVEKPRSLDLDLDLALIDGRARCLCLPVAWELLRPGGAVVLHDAQREEYHAAVAAVTAGGRATYLEPWEQGQICVIRKP
jgi:predicted O-methyltransferase YrrM